VSGLPELACGLGVDRHSAGWLSRAAPTRDGEIFRRWRPGHLAPFLSGCDNENGDTHVVGCDDVFSDAGSTPAASTNFPKEIEKSASISRRLHYFSTGFDPGFEQPNCRIDC
jgi:hypothetical protein